MSTQIPPGTGILVVDDDERLRERLGRSLIRRGLDARAAGSHGEALALVADWTPAYAVIDLKMPNASGLDVLRDLVQSLPDLRAVMLTGYGSIPAAVEAVHRGAVDFLTKPADADRILAALAGERDSATLEVQPPSLARTEWEHISRVLEDCDGNITHAAQKLGMHRRTLQRKLQKYPPRR